MTQDFGGSVGPFQAEFTGKLILPIDPEYDSARFVWKGAIKRRPAAIARCSTAREVAATLAFGRGQGLELSVRGGGATWADLDAATQAHGLEVTGGFISHTGIGGLTLGGGIGRLTPKMGLSAGLSH